MTTIEKEAFGGCGALTAFTIPRGVKSIAKHVLFGCVGLTSVTFEGTAAEWAAVKKRYDWAEGVPVTVVHCSDCDAPIK